MKIEDNGQRREFDSGAVRDIAEGKGRCDLLPLTEVGMILDDDILKCIGNFIYEGDTYKLYKAFTMFCDEQHWDIFTAIIEVSKHYEEGAKKYVERNWEKGIPLHSYIDSAIRHYIKWRRKDDDEPHDRAFLWNILSCLWTMSNKPELIDLPFADNALGFRNELS